MKYFAALHPSKLSASLRKVEAAISKSEDTREKARANNAVESIKLRIDKYTSRYEIFTEKARSILGSGARSEIAKLRAKNQLEKTLEGHQYFMEDAVDVDLDIKAAKYRAYEAKHKYGLPKVRDADDLYMQQAEQELLRSEDVPSPPPRMAEGFKKVVLLFVKLVVGYFNGLSVNKMINPYNIDLYTWISMIGCMVIAYMVITFLASLAERVKKGHRPKLYIPALAVTLLSYMAVEAWLNYEGVVTITRLNAEQQMAQSSRRGLDDDEEFNAPNHFSLMFFSMLVVAFSGGLAILEGRDKADRDQRYQNLRIRAAHLRLNDELKNHAADIDEADLLESYRPNIKPPPYKPRAMWYANAVGHLSNQENNLEKMVDQLGQQLEKESDGIQKEIFDLAASLGMPQEAQKRKPWQIPFTKVG